MKKLLFFLAITEFIIALTIHIVSALGIDIADKMPPLGVVFASFFVLLIPIILIGVKNKKVEMLQQSAMQNNMNSSTSFKMLIKDIPAWLKTTVKISGFYTTINFILLFLLPLGSFDFKDGQRLLVDHGTVLAIMTEHQYHQYRAALVRVLSGCFMGLYAHCAAILFVFSKA